MDEILITTTMSRTVQDILLGAETSTAPLKKLNDQLIAIATSSGLPLVKVDSKLLVAADGAVNLAFNPAIVPDIIAVAKRFGNPIFVNSAYRTTSQQFLLHRWFREGRISRAARPGESGHENGNAIDCENWQDLKPHFKAMGFVHQLDISGDDPYHYEKGKGVRGVGVKALQQLWNHYNAADKIAVDGVFGRQTESRLLKMPVEGY